MKPRKLAATVAALALGGAAISSLGCGGSTPQPSSPVVAPDSEEARKALAEDQKLRVELKAKEAKAISRSRKKIEFPIEE